MRLKIIKKIKIAKLENINNKINPDDPLFVRPNISVIKFVDADANDIVGGSNIVEFKTNRCEIGDGDNGAFYYVLKNRSVFQTHWTKPKTSTIIVVKILILKNY